MISPRRSTRLTDMEVQGPLLRRSIAHWLSFIGIIGLSLAFWNYRLDFPDASFREVVANCVLRFLPALILSPPLVLVYLWDTTRLSNRFTGPVRRLRRALLDVSQGRNAPSLKFRKNDYWQELAFHFNAIFADRKESSQ